MTLVPRLEMQSTPKKLEICSQIHPSTVLDGKSIGTPTLGPLKTPPSTSEQATKSADVESECGSIRIGPSELSYVGSDHWAAILDSIVDIREHFEEQEQFHLTRHSQDSVNDIGGYIETELPRSSHALLLYGSVPFASRSEVLSALPPKNAADRYVSRYFNRLDLVHCKFGTYLLVTLGYVADPDGTNNYSHRSWSDLPSRGRFLASLSRFLVQSKL